MMADHEAHGRRPLDGEAGERTRPPRGNRYAEPVGRTGAFVAAVRARRGDGYVRSWLSELTCQFENCVVWTHDMGAIQLNRDCDSEIVAHGVVIRVDAESRAHYRHATDAIFKTQQASASERATKKLAKKLKREGKS